MNRKGLFTPEQENLIAEALDFFIKFKNPVIESFDKSIFLIGIKAVDNQILDRIIIENWKQRLIPVIDAAINRDKSKVRELTVEFLNTKLGDEIEFLIYDITAKFLATAIDYYVTKKQA